MEHEIKDVANRIGRLLLRNPADVHCLLKKHNVDTGTATPEELTTALAQAIAENDERFNYELATLLADPRYSYPVGITIAIISGISALLSGGMGLVKGGVDKRTARDNIAGQIRLSYLDAQKEAKAQQEKKGLLILAFLFIIIMITGKK
ncbi:MAG: hypothetical protein AAB875_05100 [Patescibacteria group bacterium]